MRRSHTMPGGQTLVLLFMSNLHGPCTILEHCAATIGNHCTRNGGISVLIGATRRHAVS